MDADETQRQIRRKTGMLFHTSSIRSQRHLLVLLKSVKEDSQLLRTRRSPEWVSQVGGARRTPWCRWPPGSAAGGLNGTLCVGRCVAPGRKKESEKQNPHLRVRGGTKHSPDHLITWSPDHMTTWPPDHLITWSPDLGLVHQLEDAKHWNQHCLVPWTHLSLSLFVLLQVSSR